MPAVHRPAETIQDDVPGPAPVRRGPARARLVVASVAGAAAVLSFAGRADAIYIRHDVSASTYNAFAGQSQFSPVGYLTDAAFAGEGYASGTLVAPNKVLTAAHVVDDNADGKVDDMGWVRGLMFGTQKNVPTSIRSNVASVVVNSAYKGGNSAYDLAVITLKTPVTNVAPARLSSLNRVGYRGALVGYGFQGTGKRDGLSGVPDKLAAVNQIGKLDRGSYLTDFDSPDFKSNQFGPPVPLDLEGTTAPGDSGGPLMGYFGNNIWRIVGVLNGGYNTRGRDSWYGDVSIYASLTNTTNINFLKAQGLSFDNPRSAAAALAGTGVSGGTRDALSPSAVPEPGSAAAVALLAVGLLARRRRRA